MKSKILIFALMATLAFVALPSFGFEANAQRGQGRGKSSNWGNHGKQKWYPRRYKNYGQYRSAQAHRRNRYRMERRYYYRDGIRLSRWIRIYY